MLYPATDDAKKYRAPIGCAVFGVLRPPLPVPPFRSRFCGSSSDPSQFAGSPRSHGRSAEPPAAAAAGPEPARDLGGTSRCPAQHHPDGILPAGAGLAAGERRVHVRLRRRRDFPRARGGDGVAAAAVPGIRDFRGAGSAAEHRHRQTEPAELAQSVQRLPRALPGAGLGRVPQAAAAAGRAQRPDLRGEPVLAAAAAAQLAPERGPGAARRPRDAVLPRPRQHLPQILLPALHPRGRRLLRLQGGARGAARAPHHALGASDGGAGVGSHRDGDVRPGPGRGHRRHRRRHRAHHPRHEARPRPRRARRALSAAIPTSEFGEITPKSPSQILKHSPQNTEKFPQKSGKIPLNPVPKY